LKSRDVFELTVLAAIWGSSFLFMRIAAPEFGPIALIATRVAVAAVFLAAIVAARGGIRDIRAHAGSLLVLGALSSAIPFTLFAYSVLSVTAGFASILNATVPLFGAIVAYLWLGDRLGPVRVAGLAIGFAGVVVLVSDRLTFTGGGSGPAVAAGLSASFLYGVGASFTKRKLSQVDPLVNATGSQIGAALLLLIPAVIYWPARNPSRLSWSSAIVLGILCTGIALFFFFRLIARIGPAKTITLTYLIPAFGVLWGFLFLNEPVSTRMMAGSAVILLGTALASGLIPSAR
jgi:drug/metabolite transporter (DMT)-like permease